MPYNKKVMQKHGRRPGSKLSVVQKKQVKRLITGVQEIKAINSTVNGSPDAAGVISRIQTPAQGDGLSERSGDQILLKALQFRLSVIGADTTNKIRIVIFRWSQDNSIGANVPTVTGILQNLDVMSFYNYTSYKNDRMTVLYDRTVSTTFTDANQVIVLHTLYGKKLGKKILEFNAASTLGTNQIYMLLISDSVAATHPSVTGFMQLRYTDS